VNDMAREIGVQARRWQLRVWSEDGPPGPTKRAILQVLFDLWITSPTGEAFPSAVTVAEKAGISERSARDHLRELEAGAGSGGSPAEKVGKAVERLSQSGRWPTARTLLARRSAPGRRERASGHA